MLTEFAYKPVSDMMSNAEYKFHVNPVPAFTVTEMKIGHGLLMVFISYRQNDSILQRPFTLIILNGYGKQIKRKSYGIRYL